MNELVIPKQQIELNKITLESLLNNATYGIKDKIIAREGGGVNIKNLNGQYASLLAFFAEQKAVREILKSELRDKPVSEFILAYATYVAAERAMDAGYFSGDFEDSPAQNFFKGFSIDFSKDYPDPRNNMLEIYSKVIWQNRNLDLGELTNNYFEWLKAQSIDAKEKFGWAKYEHLISQDIGIKFEGDTRLFKGFANAVYTPEGFGNAPHLCWDDFGGYEDIKEKLKDLVLIIKNLDFFKGYIEMKDMFPRGILLIGPPGTGKTFLANIFCAQAGTPFVSFGAEDVGSKYQFETSLRLKKKFQEAAYHILKGGYSASLLFIDEIEAITSRRYGSGDNNDAAKVVNTFNNYMDGNKATPGVIVIGATNRPDVIDDAIMRDGRFTYQFVIGLPDDYTLERIFKVHAEKRNKYAMRPVFKDIDYKGLSKLCSNADLLKSEKNQAYLRKRNNGFTGAVIKEIHNRALREHVLTCFKEGREVTPLITEDLVRCIESYKQGSF